MKVSIVTFWGLAAFFFVADVVYIIWGLLDPLHLAIEWAGATALGLTSVMFVFLAFYLMLVHRAQGAELPEDIRTANIDDGDPEVGFYSPWSWWPVALAFSAALLFLGIGIGFWIAYIGIACLLISITGWVYEYYRGFFAR